MRRCSPELHNGSVQVAQATTATTNIAEGVEITALHAPLGQDVEGRMRRLRAGEAETTAKVVGGHWSNLPQRP
jgi:hypothetical protein